MVCQLLNDVVKPWDELNALLVERFAFDPDQSDVTRMASALAVAIKHQVDRRDLGRQRKQIDDASEANSLMSDVADVWKHGLPLYKPERNNKLSVTADFEYDGTKGFRFIRTSVIIEHASKGEHDFMVTSLAAVGYWMDHLGIRLERDLAVAEGPAEFFPTAWLTYNAKYCIHMDRVRVRIFERLPDHTYRPVDVPVGNVEIR
jgi:hypothetical protein